MERICRLNVTTDLAPVRAVEILDNIVRLKISISI